MNTAEKEQYMIKLMEDDKNQRHTNMLVSTLSKYSQNGKKNNEPDIRIQGMNATDAVIKLKTSVRNNNFFDRILASCNLFKPQVKGPTSSKANVLTFLEFSGANRNPIGDDFEDEER
jgi:hypothetical protein